MSNSKQNKIEIRQDGKSYKVILIQISGETNGMQDSFATNMGTYKVLKNAQRRAAELTAQFQKIRGAL